MLLAFFLLLCEKLLSFFKKEKKNSAQFGDFFFFLKLEFVRFALWTNWLFLCKQSFSILDWPLYCLTDFNYLKCSVGVESLVRHWCWWAEYFVCSRWCSDASVLYSFNTAVWLSGSSDVVRTKFSNLSVAIDVGLVRLSAWVRFSNLYDATDVDPKSVPRRKTQNTV